MRDARRKMPMRSDWNLSWMGRVPLCCAGPCLPAFIPPLPGGARQPPPGKMLWGGGEEIASIVADVNRWSAPMQTPNDLSQSRIVLKQDSTLIAVIEMSLSSWLVAGIVPGVERQPLKKLAVDESAWLKGRDCGAVPRGGPCLTSRR